jgi:uncharacterized repeat protein (TIGR03899 family)
MGDFNLIKIDGKPSEKLIDVVSKAIGRIYTPRAIRKEADAKAYEIEVIEGAKTKAYLNRQELKQDLLDRIEERVLYREVKKQNNIDAVTMIAAEELKNENDISDTPVDEDWTVRFFNVVEDVSDEMMQQLWGRILAGEVKNPNSFSIRTIECLRNITKQEAELFTKAANFVITSDNTSFIFNGDKFEILEKNGFYFDEFLVLVELGLIQTKTDMAIICESLPEDRERIFVFGKNVIKATKKANTIKMNIPVLILTRAGSELLKLLSITPIEAYINNFYTYLQQKGFIVEKNFT